MKKYLPFVCMMFAFLAPKYQTLFLHDNSVYHMSFLESAYIIIFYIIGLYGLISFLSRYKVKEHALKMIVLVVVELIYHFIPDFSAFFAIVKLLVLAVIMKDMYLKLDKRWYNLIPVVILLLISLDKMSIMFFRFKLPLIFNELQYYNFIVTIIFINMLVGIPLRITQVDEETIVSSSPIEAIDPICASCGNDLISDRHYCLNCGSQLEDDKCQSCGFYYVEEYIPN